MSCEWNWKAYPSTSGLCGSCGGGKKAFDLNDATTLEQGQVNEDPCLLPQRTTGIYGHELSRGAP